MKTIGHRHVSWREGKIDLSKGSRINSCQTAEPKEVIISGKTPKTYKACGLRMKSSNFFATTAAMCQNFNLRVVCFLWWPYESRTIIDSATWVHIGKFRAIKCKKSTKILGFDFPSLKGPSAWCALHVPWPYARFKVFLVQCENQYFLEFFWENVK
jgi:hypothetical protein